MLTIANRKDKCFLFCLICGARREGVERDRGKEKERDDSHENLIDWGNLFEFPQLVFAAWI